MRIEFRLYNPVLEFEPKRCLVIKTYITYIRVTVSNNISNQLLSKVFKNVKTSNEHFWEEQKHRKNKISTLYFCFHSVTR